MTISSFHGVDSPLFAHHRESRVDIKSPLYRGSNAPLEQPEEEEEEEEEEERERNVCGRARAREAGESRRGALLRASEAALSSSIKI